MSSVLVVDDEDVLLDMITALIEDLGYHAVTATNGIEALNILQSEVEPPFLIISDIMMPKMSGTALAQHVRADPRLRHVPIVLMSAAGRVPKDSTADYFMHKPFDLDHIEQVIERYAHRGPAH